jgi:hypothetical protein
MEFVNASLILGGAFVAVPIVLHLVMRQQPKQLEFPALRFLRQRREANRRRLRLKQWLLLILRCAVLVALAAALARPSVASAMVGNWLIIVVLAAMIVFTGVISAVAVRRPATRLVGIGSGILGGILLVALAILLTLTLRHDSGVLVGDRQAPVAAALVFDTSPRMEYRHENQTRLEKAQELADWLIRQLPDESEAAVFSSRSRASVFAVDLGAAKAAVDSLQTTSVPQPLPEVVADAVTLVRTSDRARREVYVFTDLSDASWQAGAAARLRSQLGSASDVLIYLLDVGVEDARNWSLGELRLSAESLSRNAELTIQTEVSSRGPGGQKAAELHLEDRDEQRPIIVDGEVQLPTAQRRSRQSVNVTSGGSALLQFTIRGLQPGTTQGRVQLVGGDNLAIDDVRFFTISVNEAWPVLVVRGVGADARWLTEAIAPYEFRQSDRARFRPEVVPQDELPEKELANYDAVCLLDPSPLNAAAGKQLVDYVQAGGGLAVFLGRNAQPERMNEGPGADLLPGTLGATWPRRRGPGPSVYLTPRSYQHSALAAFRPISTSVPWRQFPVYRFWGWADLHADANVIMEYDNGEPALIEQVVGEGRIVTMTTPVSDPANVPGRPAWNRLATGINAWPFLLLARGVFLDLVKTGDERLNYVAGQPAVLRRRSQTDPDTYLLFSPHGGRPQEVTADADSIVLKATTAVGAYRLKAKGGGFPVRGFCVNLPPSASDLQRATPAQLDAAMGADRYRMFRSREEMEPGIEAQRRGREFYAPLMLAVALLLMMENVLANRFYPKQVADAGSTIDSFRRDASEGTV